MEMVVKNLEKAERLDIYLASLNKNKSRSQWQKLAKAGAILVNGKIATPHLSVHNDDKITVGAILNSKFQILNSAKTSIEILADEPDYLVINKPSGLASDEPAGYAGASVGPILAEQFPALKNLEYYGLVHRLDAEASGCLIVAKNESARIFLRGQFHDRHIHKFYLVLVSGHTEWEEHIADFNIARASAGYKMAARPKNSEGKKAQTIFYTLTRGKKMYSLLLARALTGRTHQIRVHAKALGHPVAGDKIYNPSWKPGIKHNLNLSRLFLHCVGLELPWPKYGFSGHLKALEKRFYFSSLPKELEKILTDLKISNKDINKKLASLGDEFTAVEI